MRRLWTQNEAETSGYSDRVTGGLLGLEASWFVFIVIAVLFAGFHFMYPGKPLPTLSAQSR